MFNLPAVAIMVLITIILIVGIRESAIDQRRRSPSSSSSSCCSSSALGLTLVNDQPTGPRSRTPSGSAAPNWSSTRWSATRSAATNGPPTSQKRNRHQIARESAYVRAELALEQHRRSSPTRLVAARKLTPDDAAGQVAAARERLTAASAGIDDTGQFDDMIAKIQAEAENG